jgi:hypothetical protein
MMLTALEASEEAEHFEEKNAYNEGMKFSNLPILEFRNHVSQRGSFSQISTFFFLSSPLCQKKARAISFREYFYGLSADICAYYDRNIFSLPRKHGSLKLFFYHFHALFCEINFFWPFPDIQFLSCFFPLENCLALFIFNYERTFPRNSTEGFFVWQEEVGTV